MGIPIAFLKKLTGRIVTVELVSERRPSVAEKATGILNGIDEDTGVVILSVAQPGSVQIPVLQDVEQNTPQPGQPLAQTQKRWVYQDKKIVSFYASCFHIDDLQQVHTPLPYRIEVEERRLVNEGVAFYSDNKKDWQILDKAARNKALKMVYEDLQLIKSSQKEEVKESLQDLKPSPVPAPTEPAPTEPAPTEPAPTEPAPSTEGNDGISF